MSTHHVRMGEGGRVIIPASYRKALGVEVGDELVIRIEDGELRLFQQKAALKRLQEKVKHLNISTKDFLAFRRTDSGL